MVLRNNVLAVDTSSRVLSVALKAGAEAVFEANLEGTPRHSEQLIDLIEEALKRLRLRKTKLDQFIWGLGPGSFTGLRIGLSVLKGICLGLRKPAYGASSLDLIALGSGLVSGELAVCVDARRSGIYGAFYRFENGLMRKITGDSIFSLEALLKRADGDTVFVGDALETYGDSIRSELGREIRFLSSSFWYPRAVFCFSLACQNRKWLKTLSLRSMLPEYLQISEAEEKRNLRRVALMGKR